MSEKLVHLFYVVVVVATGVALTGLIRAMVTL